MTEGQTWVLIGCAVWICILSHRALESRERDQQIIQALVGFLILLHSESEGGDNGYHSREEPQ